MVYTDGELRRRRLSRVGPQIFPKIASRRLARGRRRRALARAAGGYRIPARRSTAARERAPRDTVLYWPQGSRTGTLAGRALPRLPYADMRTPHLTDSQSARLKVPVHTEAGQRTVGGSCAVAEAARELRSAAASQRLQPTCTARHCSGKSCGPTATQLFTGAPVDPTGDVWSRVCPGGWPGGRRTAAACVCVDSASRRLRAWLHSAC